MGSFTLLHKLCPTVSSSPKILGGNMEVLFQPVTERHIEYVLI